MLIICIYKFRPWLPAVPAWKCKVIVMNPTHFGYRMVFQRQNRMAPATVKITKLIVRILKTVECIAPVCFWKKQLHCTEKRNDVTFIAPYLCCFSYSYPQNSVPYKYHYVVFELSILYLQPFPSLSFQRYHLDLNQKDSKENWSYLMLLWSSKTDLFPGGKGKEDGWSPKDCTLCWKFCFLADNRAKFTIINPNGRCKISNRDQMYTCYSGPASSSHLGAKNNNFSFFSNQWNWTLVVWSHFSSVW